MPEVNTLVIVNPAAGSGRAAIRWGRLRDWARTQFAFEETLTAAPRDATRLASEAVKAGYERLLCVGGDGTLHEVVNGCAGSAVAVGLLPLGTGNDFARSTGTLRPPRQLLRALARGRTRAVDLGQVHGQYYIDIAGVGFDAEVARIVNTMQRRQGGALTYLLTVLRQAFVFEPSPLRVSLDGQEPGPESRRLMVAVGNAPAYAGGMRICPRAVVDDGRLDVVVVGDLRRWGILGLLPRVFVGTHVRRPTVSYQQAAEVRVDGPASAAVHADGEIVGRLPATFSVHPGALRLWVP